MAIGTTKVIASALITGTVGGNITAGAYLLSNNLAVRDRLTSEGFKLAEASDWEGIFTIHNKGDNTNLFSDDNQTVKNSEWLKGKCKEALDNKDESSYKSARQWCTKTETISAILTGGNRRVFKYEDNIKDDDSGWSTKLNKLSTNENAKQKIKITWEEDETKKITAIKAECKKIVAVNNTEKTFDEKYELAKEYCSI